MIEISAPPKVVKLDLACGQSPREGFTGVDIWSGAEVSHDLLKFPWPFEDNSVDELHCSHFVEHIPHGSGGKDLFFAFFDECWRILKPGGTMTVIAPNARSNRGFQDPTHQRYIVAETFAYLDEDWRKANKLDHYDVLCNFKGYANPTVLVEENARAPEVQNARYTHYWNTVLDWVAVLKAVKKEKE